MFFIFLLLSRIYFDIVFIYRKVWIGWETIFLSFENMLLYELRIFLNEVWVTFPVWVTIWFRFNVAIFHKSSVNGIWLVYFKTHGYFVRNTLHLIYKLLLIKIHIFGKTQVIVDIKNINKLTMIWKSFFWFVLHSNLKSLFFGHI